MAQSSPADWDFLAAAGLPLLCGKERKVRPTGKRLAGQLRRAVLEVTGKSDVDDRERKVESLQALLLALKIHFPTFYRLIVSKSPSLEALVPGRPSGKTVKLARLAVVRLADYL